MGLFDNLLWQFRQIFDTVDIVCAAALVYLLVRGRKHMKGNRFAVLSLSIPVLFYCLLFTIMFSTALAGAKVAERYYRPVFPFIAVLSSLGLYCLSRDIKNRNLVFCIFGLIFVGFMVDMLREPIRAHRRPQTEAGLWLREYDPHYGGFVISDYSQPVYYAGMKFFPARRQDLVMELVERGGNFKYMILDGDAEQAYKWAREYVEEHNWQLVYPNEDYPRNERNVRIYENPDYRGQGVRGKGRYQPRLTADYLRISSPGATSWGWKGSDVREGCGL